VAYEVTPYASGPTLQNALAEWSIDSLRALGAFVVFALSVSPPLFVSWLQRRRAEPLRSLMPGVWAWLIFLVFGVLGFWPDRFDAFNVALNRALNGPVRDLKSAQSRFREGDGEADGNFDYGTLEELGAAGLINESLAKGKWGNYTYEVIVSPEVPEFVWIGAANPVSGNTTGSGYEAVTVIFGSLIDDEVGHVYTRSPWHPDPSCKPPPEASRLLRDVMRGEPFWRNDWWDRNGWKLPLLLLAASLCAGGWIMASSPRAGRKTPP
jgi:hypothetical protein